MGSSPRVRGKPVQVRPQVADGRLIPACAGKTRPSATLSPRSPAHPRVCGENAAGAQGSSPRVRGKLRPDHHARRRGRLIPACAGKTACVRHDVPFHTAHPRVCGENPAPPAEPVLPAGSSPRVRGKPGPARGSGARHRLIPARAGKTCGGSSSPSWTWAHPRVCGENWCFEHAGETVPGSSPRVRGKLCWRSLLLLRGGLIPACAGKTLVRICIPSIWGLIPACAGKTRAPTRAPGGRGAHPRVCGENRSTALLCRPASGSSPRVRGKQSTDRPGPPTRGLIPACAGKTPPTSGTSGSRTAHPRVCGENTRGRTPSPRDWGSSPRVRGKRRTIRRSGDDEGLIPACAGKTPATSPPQSPPAAHPRVCGENTVVVSTGSPCRGSSPRVRGKRGKTTLLQLLARLIPACAGKTAAQWAAISAGTAHPRVCGENLARLRSKAADAGSSPRVRGKRQEEAR